MHKTNELFSYRYFFLCDRIRFLTQLHEGSCQSLFFLWFCPPIPKFVLTLIKEWGNNIATCQYIKEWKGSTSSLSKFFNNFVDVVEPFWDCTGQTGEHYTVKLFRKSTTCNQWYYNIVSIVLTTLCLTPLFTNWIIWQTYFWSASFAVLILERTGSPFCYIEWLGIILIRLRLISTI